MATPEPTPLHAPPLVRLLARLAQSDALPAGPSLADRLGQWTDWNRAVALSRALDGTPPAGDPTPHAFDDSEQDACERARARLVQAIDGEVPGDAESDFTPFHQAYLARQRAMLTATGHLRGRLRDALARQSPDLARLAEVDAVMERVLSPREHTLLASAPVVLGQHFTRLRQAAGESPPDPPRAAGWREAFRRDMRQLLHAELEFRFQPLEALLAALRAQPQGCHVQKSA